MRKGCWSIRLPGLLLAVPLCLCASVLTSPTLAATAVNQLDRLPVDLVLGPGDAWLATVNQTSDSVSLVRTSDGRVLNEISVGRHPIGIALAPDGKTLLVSGHYSGEVALLEVSGERLTD